MGYLLSLKLVGLPVRYDLRIAAIHCRLLKLLDVLSWIAKSSTRNNNCVVTVFKLLMCCLTANVFNIFFNSSPL
jgi:hypothetical protein